MQNKAKILFAAIVLSMAALTAAAAIKLAAEECVSATDCWDMYGTVLVECVGTDGACLLYSPGHDRACPGSMYATETDVTKPTN